MFTQIIGYLIYVANRYNFHLKQKDLLKKEKEDEIYYNLIRNKLNNKYSDIHDDIFKFAKMAYMSKLTRNNSCELIGDYSKFKTDLLSNIKSAKSYIIIELRKINPIDFQDIKTGK